MQIVLSSGSPFRPKGLAHRLHLLRPQGGWFLIRGPPLSSPGHWPCHLLSFTCPSSPPPSTVYATSPPKKQKKNPPPLSLLLPGDFPLSFHSSVLASSPFLSSPPPAPLLPLFLSVLLLSLLVTSTFCLASSPWHKFHFLSRSSCCLASSGWQGLNQPSLLLQMSPF